MSLFDTQQFRNLLASQRWPELVARLKSVPASAVANWMEDLTDEQQQTVFRLLPAGLAAGVLGHFPYFHQYILLHSRPANEMRQVLDQMPADERMRFFDELPEEAWLRLTEELGELEVSKDGEPAKIQQPTKEEPQPESTAPRTATSDVVAPEPIAEEPIIEARGVEKTFVQPDGQCVQVIAPLDLDVYPGTIVALLGASGCGKSTLLRILSGLAQPSAGDVRWHGRPLAEINPNVAIVFQSFALFPWLTVIENVEAPLLAQGINAPDRHSSALRAINTVGLKGFETAYPKELSGGMRQRVGFARALVVQPEVLFMDEPFSALDVLTAENLRGELLELWLSKKMPTSAMLIVTHNIEEAVMLADRIVVLGRHPARIRADFNVRLSQPRDRKSGRFVELVDYIYKVMTEPDVEHPLPDPESTGEIVVPPGGFQRGGAQVKTSKYQILPHARVGGIAGLLELLHDRGGREDLFRLSEDLVMDVGDLLPILEACQLLGFAWLKAGDVQLSKEGAEFADADIQTRKVLFRRAALEHVTLLKQIDSILKRKSDHSINDEFFHDVLDEHFSEEEVQRQFDTAVNWGRYAEIFDYDRGGGQLVQPEAAPLTAVEDHTSNPTPK